MLELACINQEILNTRDKVRINVLKEGLEFLETHDLNCDLLLDTVAVLYKFLRVNQKVPHNHFKFFIAAYYIVSRHPLAFPMHQSKKDFCQKFNIKVSSLEYSVEKIALSLNFIKILDDLNFPYYLNLKDDLGFKVMKRLVKDKVERVHMNFLLYNRPISSQLLSEELVTKMVFEMKMFPEELFRQFYYIISKIVEKELLDYSEYTVLQKQFFI